MRRLRWLASLVAIIALVAAACGDGEGEDEGQEGEQVTLDFWVFNEAQDEYHETIIREFEETHPNIDLEVTAYPEANYGTKLDTAIAAGDPPDLGLVFSLEYMKEGVVTPLDDVVQEAGLDLSTFNPSIVGNPEQTNAEFGCSFEGQLYCLGSYTGSVMMFYNKDMFDEAGIAYPEPWPPMTVDEFINTACELTNPDAGVWGAAYGDPVTWMPWEMVVSPDGRTATGFVNGTTSVQVHETLARGISEGCAPSLNILDPWEQGADFFARGELAMVVTDFQSLYKIEKQGINYGVTAPPTPPGLEPFFNVWTDSVGVFTGAEHPEQAKEFIEFLATEGQELRVEVTGDIPLDTQVAEELDWAGDVPGRHDALEILPHARAAVFIPNRWDTYGPIFDAFGLIVGGERTAQEALNDAAPAIQENLATAWESWEQT
jgi:multiple sugar transport system substrate-binding protein